MVHQSELDERPDALFTNITHELIFNGIDRIATRRRRGLYRHYPGSPGTGISPQNSVALTPSKKKQKNSDNKIHICNRQMIQ